MEERDFPFALHGRPLRCSGLEAQATGGHRLHTDPKRRRAPHSKTCTCGIGNRQESKNHKFTSPVTVVIPSSPLISYTRMCWPPSWACV